MLTTKNPASLTHALRDHASRLAPLVELLGFECFIRLVPLGWYPVQHRVGSQSWSITNGIWEYHFRARRDRSLPFRWAIHVFDSYMRGNEVAVLKSRRDVLRFVDSRVKES